MPGVAKNAIEGLPRLWSGGRPLLASAGTVVGGDGEVTDAPTRENIRRFVGGFAAHVERRTRQNAMYISPSRTGSDR